MTSRKFALLLTELINKTRRDLLCANTAKLIPGNATIRKERIMSREQSCKQKVERS
ncbi:MAG TPA: hypothetical protein VFJ51_07830 [Nitrososphaeraceae archaeon]|nr:hypothetical protein [Nitrososphaeraceae archaeon]